jgi:tRNA pseudouridine55 synthase
MLGKATRLASLLTGRDKTYEALIRLGAQTTTDDAEGTPVAEQPAGPVPDDAAVREALAAMVGPLQQVPPQFSAKRVHGTQAYRLARRDVPVPLAPSEVRLEAWEWLGRTGDDIRVRVTTSAGFYVRSLARDLGVVLGCGGHLAALRRTASGSFRVEDALPLDQAERSDETLADRLMPMAEALPDLPAVRVSAAGLVRVRHGNPIGPQLVEGSWVPVTEGLSKVRLLAPDGTLAALADLRGGQLHASAVLV